MGPVQNQEEPANQQLGGNEEQQEVRIPSNLVGGGNETGSKDQSEDQAEQLQENAQENPIERLNNMAALTAEDEIGAALNAVTVETEDVRAMITEENTEVLTIESSPKWGGTLIEEEQENVKKRGYPFHISRKSGNSSTTEKKEEIKR